LLARIEAFGFSAADDPLGFESRLADDQGWTLGYALAVAQEYRRFLVLTQVVGQAVSPSPDVDEAWHLHLTRTTHYESFCSAVFGKFLHHEPARSGEGAKHRDMYAETREAYRRAFGVDAPAATWPADGRRIAAPPAPTDWALPAALHGGRKLAFVGLLAAFVVAVVLFNIGLLNPLQAIGPLPFLAFAALATLALGLVGLRRAEPDAAPAERDVLEPYEVAWFSGGAERMTMTAVVTLTERGVLLAPGKPPARGPRPPIPVNATVEPRVAHPAEKACLGVVADGGVRYAAACRAMQPLADQVERRLVAAGIASGTGVLALHRARALLGLLALLMVEFERLFHALAAGHRFGFLILFVVAQVVLVLMLARPRARVGGRAEHQLKPLRLAAGRYKKAPPVGQALAFGVALVGGAVLANDLRFDGLQQQVAAAALARRAAGGGKDDGSSCSSCSSCSTSSSDGGSGGSDGGGSSCSSSSCSSSCGGGGD
jgi:uncharacterized protein (TIGR04222 family)